MGGFFLLSPLLCSLSHLFFFLRGRLSTFAIVKRLTNFIIQSFARDFWEAYL